LITVHVTTTEGIDEKATLT